MNSSRKSNIIESLEKNISASGKILKLTEAADYKPLERDDEFRFFIDDNYYTVYSNDDIQPSHIYDLLFIDEDSSLSIFETFSTLSKAAFFKCLNTFYQDLAFLYFFAFGQSADVKKPESLNDILESIYYDGDNYFFRLTVGNIETDAVFLIYFDFFINTETHDVYWENRYRSHINGNLVSFDTYDDLKQSFIKRYILSPLNKSQPELAWNDYKILQIINH